MKSSFFWSKKNLLDLLPASNKNNNNNNNQKLKITTTTQMWNRRLQDDGSQITNMEESIPLETKTKVTPARVLPYFLDIIPDHSQVKKIPDVICLSKAPWCSTGNHGAVATPGQRTVQKQKRVIISDNLHGIFNSMIKIYMWKDWDQNYEHRQCTIYT